MSESAGGDRAREIAAEVAGLRLAERAAALARLCGDDLALRAAVERALASEAMAAATSDVVGGAAETAEFDGEVAERPSEGEAEGPGSRIGPYRLVERIGEGGFGSVFLAEQERPVRRRVALKIIKLGMDTRQVVRRFELERQALAVMDHPHIAKVFDAGATGTGRPYFVMEHCPGVPITAYCDEHRLPLRARFELFVQICEAVQHAHQKGLIHRDIKPSNVLVSDASDGRPSAKVIDFGIAKATGSALAAETAFTEQAQMIGTPQYMSPEQASGSLDIDTRTDVYALGVLLYELLTGTTPFEARSLRAAAHAEMQRIIREVDPPRPSTRLSQNAGAMAAVAAQRRTEPRKLGMLVRGDVDWIVMRALEKDRGRRYDSAAGLAEDVRRYLAGEAVEAAPPSKVYRARKFARRNRGAVVASASVVAALVVGVAGFAWQARRVAAERDVAVTARRGEAEQRRAAEDQRNRAVTAEGAEKKRATELQKVVDFQSQMLSQVDPARAGLGLGEDVRAQFAAALSKSGLGPATRSAEAASFATMWGRVNPTDAATGLIDRVILGPAVAAADAQFADQPELAASLKAALAERYGSLGMTERALAVWRQVLEARRRTLGDDAPPTLEAMVKVGGILGELARNEEAERLERDALARARRTLGEASPEALRYAARLGILCAESGRLGEADGLFAEALAGQAGRLGEGDRDTLDTVLAQAALRQKQGRLAEAEVGFRRALAGRGALFGPADDRTLGAQASLGAILLAEGKYDESVGLFRGVLEARRKMLGEVHPNTVMAQRSLGAALERAGRGAESEALQREALESTRRLLGPDHPAALAAESNLGVLLAKLDRPAEAEPLCRDVLERRLRVCGEDAAETLVAMNVVGYVLRGEGKNAESEPYHRRALAIAERLHGPTHPETLVYKHNLAVLMVDVGRADEGVRLFREILDVGARGELGLGHPTMLGAARRLGNVLTAQGRYAEAVEVLARSEPFARQAYTGANQRTMGLFLTALAKPRVKLGQFADAERCYLGAQEIFLRLAGPKQPETLGCTERLADFYAGWAAAEPGKGHEGKAAEWKAKLEAMRAATRPSSAPATRP